MKNKSTKTKYAIIAMSSIIIVPISVHLKISKLSTHSAAVINAAAMTTTVTLLDHARGSKKSVVSPVQLIGMFASVYLGGLATYAPSDSNPRPIITSKIDEAVLPHLKRMVVFFNKKIKAAVK